MSIDIKIKNLEAHREDVVNKPWRPALLYLVFGFLWILFSDNLVYLIFGKSDIYTSVQTLKGWGFILITAVGLYYIIRYDNEVLYQKTVETNQKNEELMAFSEELIATESELKATIEKLNVTHDELVDHKRLLTNIYDNSHILMIAFGQDGKILHLNKYVEHLLGYGQEIMNEEFYHIFTDCEACEDIKTLLGKSYDMDTKIKYESIVKTKDNYSRNIMWSFSKLFHMDQNIFIAFGIDITNERNMEVSMNKMKYVDELTQLGSEKTFEQTFDDLTNKGEPFIIYKLDLDNFKMLNDIHGHSYGNELLKDIAGELMELPLPLNIHRWNEDEFYIIDTNKEDAMDKSLFYISSIINRSRLVKDIPYNVTASYGIGRYPDNFTTREEAYKILDVAMNSAKLKGPDSRVIYSSEMVEELLYKSAMENGIKDALEHNQFVLYFQPKYYIDSKDIQGYETLLRWPNNALNEYNIGNVINTAEITGQIKAIDQWVIENAFKTIAVNQEIFKGKTVSINLSTQSFYSEKFEGFLKEMVNKYAIDTNLIELEVTEYTIIEKLEDGIKGMNKLKALGFKMALDDFGTRYSSLNYLSRLPFDVLKIDKSYIDEIENSNKDQAIVKNIINLALDLGLEVCAEGIEEAKQLSILNEMRCTIGQGYHLSRPLSLEQLSN